MTDLTIRPVDAQAFEVAIQWAAAEGWNPGLDDLSVFHAADPDGFLIGYRDGEPVSSISVVRYGDDYGFLGFYIVHPDHRRTGAGIATWHAGMAHLAGRTVGLDGVVDQQENYRKSGFVFAGRNIRHRGMPKFVKTDADAFRQPSASDLPALIAYDRSFFPAPRENFLSRWCGPQALGSRRTLIAEHDGAIVGCGTIRRCRDGYKIGPLFADFEHIASELFYSLCQSASPGEPVSLDTPEDNPAAIRLARSAGLEPVFETARMYKGGQVQLPTSQTYGITTFELG